MRLVRPHALRPAELAAWEALASATGAASVFAEPWFLRCALEHCDPRHEALLAVVEGAGVEGYGTEWLGALAVAPAWRQGRAPVPAWNGWRHAHQFVGTPLVRAGREDTFWRALLGGLGGAGGARVALGLRDLPLDDPVTESLLRVCEEDHRAVTVDRRIERACLSVTGEGVPPILDAKQASRLRGLERKLAAELGPVSFETLRDPERIAPLLDAFLALEQAGWKGRAGSALASSLQTRALFLAVSHAAARRGRLEIAQLSAGGQVLAMSTQIDGDGRTYGFKAAYDERFARFAPGLQLLDRLTRAYCDRPEVEIDSCALPGQQPVSRLWPQRRQLVDLRIALGGAVRARVFSGMLACERTAHRLRKA